MVPRNSANPEASKKAEYIESIELANSVRMELVDFNRVGRPRVAQNYQTCSPRSSKWNTWRLAPALCLLEAAVIGLLLTYLWMHYDRLHSPSADSLGYPVDASQLSVQPTSTWNVYSSDGKTVRMLVRPASGCTQRLHDLQHSFKCKSNQTEACQPVEQTIQVQSGIPTTGPPATLISTTKSGLRLHSRPIRMERVDCEHIGGSNAVVDKCQFLTTLQIDLRQPTRQKIIGWGGALTDSTINNILSLSTNGTIRLLADYFGQDGLRFNMARLTMGGSDFSARFYTNDDLAAGGNKSDDFELENFKLMEEDVLYKIPVVKYIQNELMQPGKQLKLFASMWSPPVWMKTNGHFNKGQLKGSIGQGGDERYFKALADLKKRWLLGYLANSIEFWGLTVMNEPQFAVQPFLNFNTMIFPKGDYANYLTKYLGPTIRQSEHLKAIKLMVHDDNRRYLMSYTDSVLAREGIQQYVDGVSVHGYIDEDYELMDRIVERHRVRVSDGRTKELFVLPTELCSGHLPFMEKSLAGNWNRGIHYGLDIIRSLQHSAAGWVDWNMALDLLGGPGWLGGQLDSPVQVDKAKDEYHRSPMFYSIGHFSRYIPEGSARQVSLMSNDAYDYELETVTFALTDGDQLVSVIINNNPYVVDMHIRLLDLAGKASELFRVACAANSISTLVYRKTLLLNY